MVFLPLYFSLSLISYDNGFKASPTPINRKDMSAVPTPVTAPMAKEPLKIPRKTPTDLKKAAASKVCVLAPLGW